MARLLRKPWTMPRWLKSAAILAGAVLAAAVAHRTATGTLAAYDPATRLLTVRSATGETVFHVAADARAWLGSRRLSVRQLGEHAGAQVTVAWSERDGERTTHTVRLAETRTVHGE